MAIIISDDAYEDCQDAFEKWFFAERAACRERGLDIAEESNSMWQGWEAAWNHVLQAMVVSQIMGKRGIKMTTTRDAIEAIDPATDRKDDKDE